MEKKKKEDYRTVMHFLITIEPDKMSKSMIEYFYAHLNDDITNNDFDEGLKPGGLGGLTR